MKGAERTAPSTRVRPGPPARPRLTREPVPASELAPRGATALPLPTAAEAQPACRRFHRIGQWPGGQWANLAPTADGVTDRTPSQLVSRRARITHRWASARNRAGSAGSPIHDRAVGWLPRPFYTPRADAVRTVSPHDRAHHPRSRRARPGTRVRLRRTSYGRSRRDRGAARTLATAEAQHAPATAPAGVRDARCGHSSSAVASGRRAAAVTPAPHQAARRHGGPPPLRRLQ